MTDIERIEREAVISEALTWLKTPYHHAGRVKGAGVDCSLFVAEVFERCGLVERITPEHYPPDWNLHRGRERLLEVLEKYARRVECPLPADVAVYLNGRCASHSAIVIEWPNIIHAIAEVGVVLADDSTECRMTECFHGFYRLRRWA